MTRDLTKWKAKAALGIVFLVLANVFAAITYGIGVKMGRKAVTIDLDRCMSGLDECIETKELVDSLSDSARAVLRFQQQMGLDASQSPKRILSGEGQGYHYEPYRLYYDVDKSKMIYVDGDGTLIELPITPIPEEEPE